MRFTLLYDGPLVSRGKPREKSEIRSALHPQLQDLWTHQPLVEHRSYLREGETLCVLREVDGRTFAPLVTSELCLAAELDILLLRPERPGGIITSGGDIDNRLKTLFDALRAPHNKQELVPDVQHHAGGPTFTLVEDDSLIRRFNVETDRLLDPSSPNHVRMVIRVRLIATRLIYGNMSLVG